MSEGLAEGQEPPALQERSKAVVVSLETALAGGEPLPGNLAVSIFAHGSLDAELYTPREIDRQKPHARDEVYVVARGEGLFFDGEATHEVREGSFVFVPAGQEHRFEQFTSDFAVWVFFYGPEGGEAGPKPSLGSREGVA